MANNAVFLNLGTSLVDTAAPLSGDGSALDPVTLSPSASPTVTGLTATTGTITTLTSTTVNATTVVASGDVGAATVTLSDGTVLIATSDAFTDGAGVLAGTLTNAPAIGNPTKWVAIDDDGVTRYLPAW